MFGLADQNPPNNGRNGVFNISGTTNSNVSVSFENSTANSWGDRNHNLFTHTFPSTTHSGPGANLICYVDYVSGTNFKCGYSKRTRPWNGNIGYASFYNSSTYSNFVNNGSIIRYASLSDVPGDPSTLVRLTTGEVRVNGTCDSEKFIYFGVYKYCVSACHSLMTHQVKYLQGNTLCTTECASTDSIMLDDSTVCVRPDCASSGLKYYGPLGDKKCVDTCKDSYKYLYNASFCQDSCPDFVEPTSNPFHPSDETGTCVDACPISKYQLIVPTLTYSITGNPVRKYCLDACDQGIYTRYWDNGATKHCTDSCLSQSTNTGIPSTHKYYVDSIAEPIGCIESCPSNRPYYFKDQTGYKCLEECPAGAYIHQDVTGVFNQNDLVSSESRSECLFTCTNFKFESSLTFPKSKITMIYCLSQCPTGFYSVNDPADKRCVSSCDTNSPFKYSTPSFECVTDCRTSGFKYYNEDFSCSNDCSFAVDMDVACVSSCPPQRRFNKNGVCTTECSADAPFLFKYSTCVDKCPGKFHDKICVDDCLEEKLKAHYSKNKLFLEERLFVLSTKECSSKCSEPGFPFINEHTLECIEDCPIPCKNSHCPFPEIKLKDEKMFCREACTDPQFPFKDQEDLECLAKCKEIRPFYEGKDKICVSICSPQNPLVIRRNTCNSDECDTECTDSNMECVKNCTAARPFKIIRESFTECVCECPKFFLADKDFICQLECDNSLGYVENKTRDGCDHCFRDKDKKFMFQGNCVEKCPKGFGFDNNYVCKPCFDLNLWTNEDSKCVPRRLCNSLSFFEEETKTCTKCTKEGYMLIKRPSIPFACSKTECLEGYREEDKGVKFCFICPQDTFYYDRQCLSSCPSNLSYNLQSKTCQRSCSNQCLTYCCQNGSCAGAECTCSDDFFGIRCDYDKSTRDGVVSAIISFIRSKFKYTIPEVNIIDTLIDLKHAIRVSDRRLSVGEQSLNTFVKEALAYVNNFRIKYAYQPVLLHLLDGLLGIAYEMIILYRSDKLFNQIIREIDNISVEIQEFNTTKSIIPEFEVVSEAHFKGRNFNLSFGSDVSSNKSLDFSTCSGKIKSSLNIDFLAPLPYLYLTFLPEISTEIKRKANKSLVLTPIPLREISIFTKEGQTNVNSLCSENFVDLTFEVQNSKTSQIYQKFKHSTANIFNQNDPIFIDKCQPFTNESGKDVTLGRRKEEYFQDPKILCRETAFQICTVEPNNDSFNCICKGIKNRKKSALESIASSYPETNYALFTCYEEFKAIDLLTNYGFYVILTPLLVSLLFSCYAMNRMNKKLNSNDRFEYIRRDLTFFDPESMKKQIYFEECLKVKELALDPGFVAEVKNVSPETITAGAAAVPTINDLDCLNAADLMKYDRRSMFAYSKDILFSDHSFLVSFQLGSPLNPQVYTILLYCTEINVAVMLNAFFIEDSLVDSKNDSEGGFFDSFRDELPKTFWALVTTKVFMFFVTGFYKVNQRKAIKMESRLINEENSVSMKGFDSFMTSQRVRLVFFVLVTVCFNCVLGYFVVIYVHVFRNSSDIWVNGVITGLLVDNLVIEMFGPLVLILSRKIAKSYASLTWVYTLGLMLARLKKFRLD